jgi:hypothetical protein
MFEGHESKWARRAVQGDANAAFKLFASALPGWAWELHSDNEATVFDHRDLNPDFPEGFDGKGDSPAAALLDAITKAVKSTTP